MMLPDRPEPEPEAGAPHDTEADVALLVVQLKVAVLPAITVEGENDAVATPGAATTDRLAAPVAGVPAGL